LGEFDGFLVQSVFLGAWVAVLLELGTEGSVRGGAKEPFNGLFGVCHGALDLDFWEGDLVQYWIGQQM
jgi:hypothetical protein